LDALDLIYRPIGERAERFENPIEVTFAICSELWRPALFGCPHSLPTVRKADAVGMSGLNMSAARLSPGAISDSNSSHLPPSVGSKRAKPVMFPPGRLSRGTMPLATGLVRERSYPIGIIAVPPKLHPHIAAIGPTQGRKRLREPREARLPHGIVFVAEHEHADAPNAVALLRVRRERPCSRAAE
jgi:hypothetical protein